VANLDSLPLPLMEPFHTNHGKKNLFSCSPPLCLLYFVSNDDFSAIEDSQTNQRSNPRMPIYNEIDGNDITR
jgi:hypothetical protein